MQRIQKLSILVSYGLKFFLVALPTLTTMTWYFFNTPWIKSLFESGIINYSIKTPKVIMNLHAAPLSISSQWICFSGELIGLLPLWLGLLALIKIFKNYQNQAIFILDNARLYQKLGWLCFLNAFMMRPLSDILLTLGLTFDKGPGHRYIELGFGTPNLQDILMGTMIVIIAQVMIEGHRLQQDQNDTI